MKSIHYMLTGKPGNLDDCLDFAKKNQSCSVSVKLETHQSVREIFVLIQYVAKLKWKCDGQEITHAKVLYDEASWINQATPAGAKIANHILEDIIERMNAAGVEVNGASGKFSAAESCNTGCLSLF